LTLIVTTKYILLVELPSLNIQWMGSLLDHKKTQYEQKKLKLDFYYEKKKEMKTRTVPCPDQQTEQVSISFFLFP